MTKGGPLTECARDGHPADGARLCSACWADLAARLAGVPELLDELEVSIARQARTAADHAGRSGSDEPPLPFDDGASEARAVLLNVLGAWCRDVAAASGLRVDAVCAEWLTAHPGAVRHHPEAGELYDEITDAIWQAVRAIDQRPGSAYAGQCRCGASLYARKGSRSAVCRLCESEYRVDEQRAEMLADLVRWEGSAADVSRVLAAVGMRVSAATIRRWVRQRRLVPCGWRRSTLGGRPHLVFRAGDVVDAAAGVT